MEFFYFGEQKQTVNQILEENEMEISSNGLHDTLLDVDLTVQSPIQKHLIDTTTNLKANKEKKESMRRKPKTQCKESLQSLDHTEVVSALSLSDKPQGVQGNDKLNNLQRTNQEIQSSASENSRHYDKSEDRLMNDQVAAFGNMNNFLNVSHSSLERAPVPRLRKKLLILDVNGLLADIVSPAPKERKADINILRRAVFERPFCNNFLRFCFERFDVGIWSSSSKKVLDRMVDYLLGDMKHKLLLFWDISHCTRTEFKTLENRHKSIVFKELRKIWEKSDPNLPWEKGDYSESNTLLLDDSPYKALLNPAHTGIFPWSYSFQDGSDNSLGPGGDIRLYLEGLASADNCKEYVEKHPFGQSGIDENNPLWDFYSRILRSLSNLSSKVAESEIEDGLINDRVAAFGNTNNFLNNLHSSLERAPVPRLRKKLLILDVNGLLADIVSPAPKEQKADINILRRAVFKRPFCCDFLRFCFERFDVGIWSSRSKKVLDRMVDYLLGDMKHRLLLFWDISHCTITEFKSLENRHKSIVFKELRKIWEKSDPNLPWEIGDYNESNTLLLDDSPYKALLNPVHTGIFPLSYSFEDVSDKSLGPEGDVRLYLEGWASADNCKEYVEKHPFGQSCIDENNPLWDFYSSVLRSHSNLSSIISSALQ